ncbi:MAG: SAM-dependent methyltransferase [Deltaproteobacteria bacterium]|nr:SAM-dependent methyltransferase [Deltaproteobacteria bacterium]
MRRQIKSPLVAHELLPGASVELLQELHLLTRAGDLNADALRKLKQVNHLIRLLTPALEDVLTRFGDPVIVDCGAGKSHLGFLIYELFLKGIQKGQLHCIEARPELTTAAAALASRLDFSRMRFQSVHIADPVLPDRVAMVTALHACDTATDDAIALAVQRNADHVAVVPCCQAEVARQLEKATGADPVMASLHDSPWHRREFGSHLTNVVRVLALEAKGYKVTVTELTGWEHSLKNELILGKKVRARSAEAEEKLRALLSAAGVAPKVARLLGLAPANREAPVPERGA